MNTKKSYQSQEKIRFLPKLTRAYKRTTLTEKVVGFGAVGLLLASIFFNGGSNPLWAIAGFAVIVGIINLLVYKAKLVIAGAIFAAHIAILPTVAGLYAYLRPDGPNGDIVSPIMVLLAATVFFSILAYRVCRGRYWLNLILVLFALDFGGLLVSLGMGLNWGTGTGILLALIAVVLRAIPWFNLFNKGKTVIPPDLVNSTQNQKTEKLFRKLKYKVAEVPEKWPLSHIAYSQNKIYLIATLTPKRSLIINRNRFYYDGSFIEPLLYEIAQSAEKWSLEHKIEAKHIVTVAIIHDEDFFPSSDKNLAIQVSEKGMERTAGHIYLTTPDGIKELEEVKDTRMSQKSYQSIVKALDAS